MEEECDDRPHPQEVALSQTCWEYKTLLHQRNRAKRQHDDVAVRVDRAAVPSSNISSNIDHHHQQQQQHHHHHHGQDSGRGANRPPSQPPKRHKPNPPVSKRHESQPPRANAGRSVAAITSIQTLRLSGSAQRDDTRLRDLFVLVLQTSGLQQITSRAGFDVDFGTLLVADPSSAFLRVTLWRNAARVGARLIRAGDLVRLNRSGSAKKGQSKPIRLFQIPDSRLNHKYLKYFPSSILLSLPLLYSFQVRYWEHLYNRSKIFQKLIFYLRIQTYPFPVLVHKYLQGSPSGCG